MFEYRAIDPQIVRITREPWDRPAFASLVPPELLAETSDPHRPGRRAWRRASTPTGNNSDGWPRHDRQWPPASGRAGLFRCGTGSSETPTPPWPQPESRCANPRRAAASADRTLGVGLSQAQTPDVAKLVGPGRGDPRSLPRIQSGTKSPDGGRAPRAPPPPRLPQPP